MVKLHGPVVKFTPIQMIWKLVSTNALEEKQDREWYRKGKTVITKHCGTGVDNDVRQLLVEYYTCKNV